MLCIFQNSGFFSSSTRGFFLLRVFHINLFVHIFFVFPFSLFPIILLYYNISYLSDPSIISRNKKEVFPYTKEKIRRRVLGWNINFFSKAGNEALLLWFKVWKR